MKSTTRIGSFTLTAFLLLATFAEAQSGSISGSLKDGSHDLGGFINLYRVADTGSALKQTTANRMAGGAFTFTAVPDGSYYLRTLFAQDGTQQSFVDEVWQDIPCIGTTCDFSAATAVTVQNGGAVTGINFVLGSGGDIQGTISGPSGGIQSIFDVFNSQGASVATRNSGTNGSFSVGGLPSGNYFLRTVNSSGLIDELFNNIPCPGGSTCVVTSGTPITVNAPSSTTGVNVELAAGGKISGTIRRTDNQAGAADVTVLVFSATGQFIASVDTNSDGTYALTSGLESGNYFVLTSSNAFLDQLYSNIPCEGSACVVTSGAAVAVLSPATTSGIDFALSPVGFATPAPTATVTPTATPTPLNLNLKGSLKIDKVQNGKVAGTCTVKNIGKVQAPAFFVSFFHSDTKTVPDTTAFKRSKIRKLKAGKSSTLKISWPAAKQKKFVITSIDSENAVSEKNERDNITATRAPKPVNR